jgi:hypothetical protein
MASPDMRLPSQSVVEAELTNTYTWINDWHHQVRHKYQLTPDLLLATCAYQSQIEVPILGGDLAYNLDIDIHLDPPEEHSSLAFLQNSQQADHPSIAKFLYDDLVFKKLSGVFFTWEYPDLKVFHLSLNILRVSLITGKVGLALVKEGKMPIIWMDWHRLFKAEKSF